MRAEGGVLALPRGGEEGPEGVNAAHVAVRWPGAGPGIQPACSGGGGREEVPFAEGDDLAVAVLGGWWVGGRGSGGRVDDFEEADGGVGGEEVEVAGFEVGEDRGCGAGGPDGAVAGVREEAGEVDGGEGGYVGRVDDGVEG